MSDLSELSSSINEWMKHDELIKSLNLKIKEIKESKSTLEKSILETLDKHNLKNKKLKINNKHVVYNETYSLPPLSIKLLDTIFSNYEDTVKHMILESIKKYRENHKTISISLKKKAIRKKSIKNA